MAPLGTFQLLDFGTMRNEPEKIEKYRKYVSTFVRI